MEVIMKKIFLMIFLSTISFSSLYQRFNSGQEYKQEILKTDNVNERTFGFYLNADLLNKKEREQEKENISQSERYKIYKSLLEKNIENIENTLNKL